MSFAHQANVPGGRDVPAGYMTKARLFCAFSRARPAASSSTVPAGLAAAPPSAGLSLVLGSPAPVQQGAETLEDFMARLGASGYTPTLLKGKVRMQDLLTCTNEQYLMDLNLPMGPRKRIMREVERIKSSTPF